MANVVDFQVKGLKELNARMAALQKELGSKNVPAGKWMMRALHDGARVIRDEAKRIHSKNVKTGALKSGIVEHTSKEMWNTVIVRVRTKGYIFSEGPDNNQNKKSSKRAGNPNYWWLLEFGTSKMPAKSFMRPAFENKKAAALTEVRNSLARGLDAIVAKLQQIRIAA